MNDDVFAALRTALLHHDHQHQLDDVAAGRDWRQGQVACDQAAAERTYFGNIVASTARDLLAA